MKPIRRSFPIAIAGLVMAAGIMTGPSVWAQQVQVFSTMDISTEGGFGDGSAISNRNLDRYARALTFSADQSEAAKALLDGYLAESRAASKQMQSAMESAFSDFQESKDHKTLNDATSAAQKKHSAQAATLERGFFDDLQILLTPDQQERWPQVERIRRREKGLMRGSLSGESVDLTEVIAELNLDATAAAAIAEAQEQYEADMDRAIQARDAALEDSRPKDTGLGMNFDFAAMQAAMAKAREAGAQVRDVNETHERRIEVLLPENRRAEFAMAYKKRCFPEVYRASGASMAMDAALGLEDITPEQKTQIDELRAGYGRDAGPANDAWADAVVASEASGQDGAVSMGDGSVMRIQFGEQSGPLADARKARKAIDDKARERLNSILTPSQQERLPKQEEAQAEFVTGGGVFLRSGG